MNNKIIISIRTIAERIIRLRMNAISNKVANFVSDIKVL